MKTTVINTSSASRHKEKCVVCGKEFDEYSGDKTEQMCMTCILKRDDPDCLKPYIPNEIDDERRVSQ